MARADRDESYVLDLCDEALGEQGLREYRFDWLLGDPGVSSRRVPLPVDAFWPGHQMVVEYREVQHDQPVPHFDKPDRLTISGVHRGQQRALYDARRDLLIPQHGLRLVVIRPADLDATAQGRLRMTHPSPTVRYALIVPTSALRAARRVPAAVRNVLRIALYEVTDANQVLLRPDRHPL